MDPRVRVIALVLALVVVFHQTLAKVPFGVSLALFAIAYFVVFQAATRWDKQLRNPWATVFLIPACAGIFGEIWYAGDAVRTIAWMIVPTSLALFSYWVTASARSWREAFSFTPPAFFRDTFLPFRRFREHLAVPSQASGKQVWQIVLGLAVGFPLLWIITSLFSAADATFAQLIHHVFDWNILPTDAGVWFLDFLVGIFFIGFIGTALRRRLAPATAIEAAETTHTFKDYLALHTFLVALNGIFLAFVIIQILYVVQGSGHWTATGLTYADYAKQSFYQLFWVGVLVFGIAFFCYRIAGTKLRLTRILLLTLIAQTAVVLASAWTRLSLYVSAYNLTMARWWGGIGLILVACVLTWCVLCLLRKASVPRFVQGIVIGSFILLLPLVFINHEGRVAEYNIHRYLVGETTKLDAPYLLTLSSDALPPLVSLVRRTWNKDPNLQLRTHGHCLANETEIACLQRELDFKKELLSQSAERDWRLLVRSDWRALDLLRQK
jgi:hypothetical protein